MKCNSYVISAYHAPVSANPVGKHPRVCALMAGIFNNRSLKSRKMLGYLDTLPDNRNLSDKVLTHKLVLLLAFDSIIYNFRNLQP